MTINTKCTVPTCKNDKINLLIYCTKHADELIGMAKYTCITLGCWESIASFSTLLCKAHTNVNLGEVTAITNMDGNLEFATKHTEKTRDKLGIDHADGTDVTVIEKRKAWNNLKDMVNSPSHYNSLGAECEKCNEPIECIVVSETLPANLAQALQYVWRCEFKGEKIKDIKKAIWFLQRELKRIERITKRQAEKQQ